MKFKLSIFIIITCLIGTKGFSQDIHFSQFYASPLTLNPSSLGNYSGDWRAMNSYRRQWGSFTTPYVTNALGYDRQFFFCSQKISVGATVITDRSGDAKLAANKIFLAGAYHKTLFGHNLHGGLQLGLVNKSYLTDNLSFPDQFNMDIGQFDASLPTADAGGSAINYLDVNLGFSWSKRFAKIEPEVGIAFFHVNFPKETFFANNDRLLVRRAFTLSAKYYLNEKITLLPQLFMMGHTKATDYLLGSNVKYKLSKNNIKAKSIFAGLYGRDGIKRNTDAFIIVVGTEIDRFEIGISYDINISDLKAATNNKGAIEFSIIYTGLNTRANKRAIPCDRY